MDLRHDKDERGVHQARATVENAKENLVHIIIDRPRRGIDDNQFLKMK